MNQILNTKLQTNNQKNKKMFKIQFFVSSFIFLLVLVSFGWYFLSIQKKEKMSSDVINCMQIFLTIVHMKILIIYLE